MEKMEKAMNNAATVIGAHTHIRGNLEGDQDLTVIGRVDGNINLSKTLNVDAEGLVVADIQVQQAIIAGTVVGNVTASQLVHVTEQGRVVGDIAAPRIVLREGAAFRGNIDMGDMDAPPATAPGPGVRPSRAATAAPMPARPREEPEHRPAPTAAAPPPRRAPRPPRPPASRPSTEEPLERRAEAAARAVASSVQQRSGEDPAAPRSKSRPRSQRKAPRPPTTAGKRTRARRK